MANNNFFLNNDPLLYQHNDEFMRRQINDSINQYRLLQEQTNSTNLNQKDYVGELDNLLKNLSIEAKNVLQDNHDYKSLNEELSSIVQEEIMNSIKWKINSSPQAIKNIEKQINMIHDTSRQVELEQRQSISELNDYVKNYSNITFDEYKRIKGEKNNIK